nr:signal recognition particle-docking protein FtsY [Oceanococcus sp. HetDA_MAG_MS8]
MTRRPQTQNLMSADSSSSFVSRMRAKINRGDSWLTYDLGNLLPGQQLDENALEEFEDLLLSADLGVDVSQTISETLRAEVNAGRVKRVDQLQKLLRKTLIDLLKPCEEPLVIHDFIKPFVLMGVGVNGVGKTTTLGKIAAQLAQQGREVMLAAGDTYRAGAVKQLGQWAERGGVALMEQGQNADPASVIFDAFSAAKARGVDVLLADTAGRLHTQGGLMDELRKIKRVLQKQEAYAPHEVLLVVDATSGHNALQQAIQFHEAVGLTGLAITKLDGTARGGTVFAIAKRLGLPIRFIGVGEQLDDLGPFQAEAFVDALLSGNTPS